MAPIIAALKKQRIPEMAKLFRQSGARARHGAESTISDCGQGTV